jgi:transcriptional regulator with XRE-family HTH domain
MVLPALVEPLGLRWSRCGSERKRPPVPEVRSPTVRRRELGALLRSLRQARGMTVDQVAAELLCSPSKVSRMETGSRAATLRDVRDLCDLYDVTDPAERERMSQLAAEGKQQGWWQEYELPYSTYVGLEQEAASMRIYHSAVVPGLLQVDEYSRALHESAVPRYDDPIIDQRIQERHTRQRLLSQDNPPEIDIVLDEAVLRRLIGGADAMYRQLGRLIEVSGQPNVTIQVLPFTVGQHPALESNFVLLAFGGQASDIIYAEGLVGQVYLDRPQDLRRYAAAFEILREISLSPQDSKEMITEIRKTYAVA